MSDEDHTPAPSVDGGSPGASDAEGDATPLTTREAWSDEEAEDEENAALQSSTTQAAWSDEDEVVVPDNGDDNGGEGEVGADGSVAEGDDASASKSRKEKRASKAPLDPAAAAQAEAALLNLSKAIVKHLKKAAGGVGEKVPLKEVRTALGVQASKGDFKTAVKSAAKLPSSGFVVDGKDLRLPTAAERADAVKAEAAAKVAAVRASAVQSAVDKSKQEAERKKGTEDATPPPDSTAKSPRGSSKGGVRFEEGPSDGAESKPPAPPAEGLSLDDEEGVPLDDSAATEGTSGLEGEGSEEGAAEPMETIAEDGPEEDADAPRDENEAVTNSGGAGTEALPTGDDAEGSDSMSLEELKEALEEGILTQEEFDTLAAALAAEEAGSGSSSTSSGSSSSGVGWGSFGSAVGVSSVRGLGSDLGASVFDAWGTISTHASQAAASATGGRAGPTSEANATNANAAAAAAPVAPNDRPTGGAGADAWIEGSLEQEAEAGNGGEVGGEEEGWEGVSTVSAAAYLAQEVEREAQLEAEAEAEANAMLEAAKKPKDEDALHSLVIDGLATIEELREVRKAYRAASEKIGGKDLDKVGFKSLVKGLAKLRYEGLDVSGMKDKDLDVAFIIADEDKSGGVDLDEFLNLYKLIKKGEVVGLGALSADARTKKRQFKAALASARDAERHIAMALAAAADEKARDDEEVGNRHKSEPQIAAERELAIKVGRLMTMSENELKRGLLEEGFKFRAIQQKSGDECRLLLSTKWTQVVREMSLSPEERAKLEEKRAAERAAEAEKLKPAEAIAAIPEENSGTTNSIHSESYNSAGSGAGLGTEVPPPPPPPPLQQEAAAKDGPPAGEANSFLSILASFG